MYDTTPLRRGLGLLGLAITLAAPSLSHAQLDLTVAHPAFAAANAGDTVRFQCSGVAVLSTSDVHVTGSCETAPHVQVSERVHVFEETVGGLQSLMTCTFTVADSCHQPASLVVEIAVYDTVAPLLQDVPADRVLEAGQDFPPAASVYAIDNCSRNLVVQLREERQQDSSHEVLVRTWSVQDEAGNGASARQTLRRVRPAGGSSSGCGELNLFAVRSLSVGLESCTQAALTCLSEESFTGTVSVNGVGQAYTPCTTTPTVAYPLPGDLGTAEVIWAVGATTVRGRIANRAELLTLFQTREPDADWAIEDDALVGDDGGRYRELQLLDAVTGEVSTVEPRAGERALGIALKLGEGRHTVIARTEAGCVDTVHVNVACTDYLTDTVTAVLGLTGRYCVDLPGDADDYEVLLDVDGVRAVAVSQPLDGCFDFTALHVGSDDLTIDYCTGGAESCTRLALTIVVVRAEDVKPPTATPDLYGVAVNGQRMFEVALNDEVAGGLTSVTVLTPTRGNTRVDAHGRIHYRAPLDWCGDDSFRYEVCNEGGCDEALATVQVTCEELVVFNGFSPNGDGQNDAFTVLGIENYPDNRLVIFNQHGHEVYAAEAYANDWRGTHKGTRLVDGTYFYVLEVEGRDPQSGYVQIKR